MAASLIPIDKRMVQNKGEAEGCCLGGKIWIEVSSTKTLARLSQGRLKGAEVPDSTRAAPPFYDGLVKC